MTKKLIIALLIITCSFGILSVNAEFQNNNPLLKNLQVNIGTLEPSFDYLITEYEILLPENINELLVEAIPDDSNANVSILGNKNLIEGVNRIYVEVTAEDGLTKKTYTINALRGDTKKSTPNLKGLNVKDYVLIPAFDPNIIDYIIEIKDDQENVEVQAVPENENAKIEITGNNSLLDNSNVISIEVTSENEANSKIYTVLAVKEGRDTRHDNDYNASIDTYTNTSGNISIIPVITIIVIASIVIAFILYMRRKKHGRN